MSKVKMQFDPDLAKEIGVEEAIMYSNIEYWCFHNQANKVNFFEGKYWTYNSASAFTELFTFWTEKQIRRILDNLIKSGYLLVGNFSDNKYDRTRWYSVASQTGGNDLPKTENGSTEVVKSSYTDNKPNKENTIYLDFLNLLNSLTNHKYRPTKKSESQFNARLKEGWTAEEVAVAVRNAVKVEYHQSTKFRYLTPEFFTRADKLNMYSQNANDSLNDEEKYRVLFAKGWKNCDQSEVEWAYDYQHRDEMSYSKYVRTELLGNRGSKKTAAEYDAE